MENKKDLSRTLLYAVFSAIFSVLPMFWMTSYLGFWFVTLAFFSALISISYTGIEKVSNGSILQALAGIGITFLFIWHAIVILAMLKGDTLEIPSQYYNESLITMSKNHNFHKEIMIWGIYAIITLLAGLIIAVKQAKSKLKES